MADSHRGAMGTKTAPPRPPSSSTPPKKTGQRTYISWVALALMTTGSVASLRSAPTMAIFGLASVFLYLVPAIVFFVPTSLVSAELASGWKGGVYNWVRQGTNSRLGFLAIWCQFASMIFYYPTLLAYVGSTIAYIVNPKLANSGVYTAAIIIVLYWGGVLVVSKGMGLVSKLSANGTVIGTLIPLAFIVVMGAVYLGQGNRSAAPMSASHLLPAWTGIAGLVLVVNNFLAYSGMEMNAVHVDEMKNPSRDFPKAIFLAMGLVLLIFILPALAISWIIPSAQISLTAGVMQAFSAFFGYFNINFLTPITALAMVVAMLSGMVAWLVGPSKGLLQIGRLEGYLPPYFQKVNKDGIQMRIIINMGILVTIIGLLYAFIPGVSNVYWIFSAMTTQVYLIMYVLMFIAAAMLRRRQPDTPRGYRAPTMIGLCVVGTLASVLAFLVGFVPPSQFGHKNPVLYGLLLLAGIVVIGILPPIVLYRVRKPSWKETPEARAEAAAVDSGGTTEPAQPAEHGEPTEPAKDKVPAAGADAAHPSSATGPRVLPEEEVLARRRRDRIIGWAAAAVVIILVIVGVSVYDEGVDNQLARTRATAVEALFVAHHLQVPVRRSTLISVLGDNGGAVCANPNGYLVHALRNQGLANGAANVGVRPILTDSRVFAGEGLVLQVYCPQELPGFHKYVNGKRFERVQKQ